MPVYDGIDGVVRKRKEWPVGIDGVVRQQKEHWAGIDGVQRKIFIASGNVYGAEWDGSSNPKWTRTDAAADFADPNPAVNNGTGSSPFDDLLPWSGMTVTEDSMAGTLVSIPKFYYKWTRTGPAMKLQISPESQNGFFVSPAHADRGDGKGERDIVYVGRYHSGNVYNSASNVYPMVNITRSGYRSGVHSMLGSTIWQYDFAMYWTIMMLYLVEYANWNSQAVIGYGCSPNGVKFLTGLTDGMLYHTGTTAASRTTYGCCQYRHIEGLWDNVYDWVDGIYFNRTNIYCIKNPANFNDNSGGSLVGTRATSSGGISGWTNPTSTGFEYALYPNAVLGNENTFVCDYCNYSSGGSVLIIGGYYNQNQYLGAFYMVGNFSGSTKYEYIGCRLMKLP